MPKERKVQILINETWHDIDFENLRKDNVFRMFEPDGEPVKDDYGKTEWIAISDVFYNDEAKSWSINLKSIDE